jgi:hypothetical protein
MLPGSPAVNDGRSGGLMFLMDISNHRRAKP